MRCAGAVIAIGVVASIAVAAPAVAKGPAKKSPKPDLKISPFKPHLGNPAYAVVGTDGRVEPIEVEVITYNQGEVKAPASITVVELEDSARHDLMKEIWVGALKPHQHFHRFVSFTGVKPALGFAQRQPPPGEPDARPRFAVAWCHGAPGIALSRLRAAQIDNLRRSQYIGDIEAALETTCRQLERSRAAGWSDPTPCHGTAGLIETLLTAGRVLPDPAHETLAREAAGELAGWVVSGTRLRSGTLCGGPNPSLMLGTAGVGYELLRVHDPDAVPSLLIGPAA